MSEETKFEEHNCKCKKLTTMVVLSFLLSLAALGLSIYILSSNIAATPKKVVISTQYDKGKSLAKAQETKKPVIVFFYTDWCSFCQRFAPTYAKFAKTKDIKKNFAIAYVNCEKEENAKLMQEYGVQGFPTVFVIDKDGNRTQLENQTFFVEDAVKLMSENALKAINKDDKDEDKKEDKED